MSFLFSLQVSDSAPLGSDGFDIQSHSVIRLFKEYKKYVLVCFNIFIFFNIFRAILELLGSLQLFISYWMFTS